MGMSGMIDYQIHMRQIKVYADDLAEVEVENVRLQLALAQVVSDFVDFAEAIEEITNASTEGTQYADVLSTLEEFVQQYLQDLE